MCALKEPWSPPLNRTKTVVKHSEEEAESELVVLKVKFNVIVD